MVVVTGGRELPVLPEQLLHVDPGGGRRLHPRVRGVQGGQGHRGAGVVAGPPHQGLPAQPVLPPQVQARAQGPLRLPRRLPRRRRRALRRFLRLRRTAAAAGAVLTALGLRGAPQRVARAPGRHRARRRRGPAPALAAPPGLRAVHARRHGRASPAAAGGGEGHLPARPEEVLRHLAAAAAAAEAAVEFCTHATRDACTCVVFFYNRAQFFVKRRREF
jgi:hypothetical protein